MMGYPEFRPIGRKKQDGLIAKFEADLGCWSSDWSAPGNILQILNAEDAPTFQSDLEWIRISAADRALTLGMDAGFRERFGILLAGASSGCNSGIAARVGNRAILALCAAWLDEDIKRIKCEIITRVNPALLDARYGNVALVLTSAGVELQVICHLQLIDYYFPKTAPSVLQLIKPLMAASEESVPMQVMIDLGSVPLAMAVDLKVGDVLVSGTCIDSDMTLTTFFGGERLAAVSLHRKDSIRTIQILASERTQC